MTSDNSSEDRRRSTPARQRRLWWLPAGVFLFLAAAALLGLWAGSKPDFERLAPMSVPRRGFSATLLQGWNRVLIAGGEDANGKALASWEVFDLRARSFIAKGSLFNPRRNHVAVLSGGWKVLIAGGDDGRDCIRQCEIVDAAAGSVELGPMLNFPRAGCVADGGIIAGGASEECGFEWYDGKTGKMGYASAPGATLRGAAIFFLGNDKVFYGGGCRPDGTVNSEAWIIDRVAKTCASTGRMKEARFDACVTHLDKGPLLVIGGTGPDGKALATTETFDEAKGFEYGPPLLWPVSAGSVLPWQYWMNLHQAGEGPTQFARIVVGGCGEYVARRAQLLKVPYDHFERGPKLVVPRYGAQSMLLLKGSEDFDLAVFGGTASNGRATAGCEIIDPYKKEQESWFMRWWSRLRGLLP
jgi:hypothetical protein